MKDIRRSLQIKPVGRFEHFSFNLYEFNFFKKSEWRSALPFRSPRLLDPFVALAYVLLAEVTFFRKKRYFVKLNEHVAGVLVLQEKLDSLSISSLAVAPETRRRGIATYILSYAERLSKGLGKEWLELSVLKKNTPALRLYNEFEFVKKEEKKWSFILSKKV
jgi:ribosomal protein S18 acetylase RimI-like enzyme